MIGIGIADSLGVNLSGLNPATKSFITSAGISDAGTVTTINNLVNGLQASGLWSKMKAVYPFVTDNRNLLSYTEDFGNAIWSKGGGTTVTNNSTIAPNGTTTADTIVLPNTGTIAQELTSTTSRTFTFSIYLRASSNTTIKIGFVSPSVVTTCNVTTNWQRFTITHTFVGVTYPQIYNDTGVSVTLFGWGAQVELGSTATTYQPIATTQQAYIASQFKYNLKDPRDADAAFRLVFNGGWTFANTGATPNGVNGYADSKYNPSVSGQLNSAHISYYSRTNVVGTQVEMGNYTSNGGQYLLYNYAGQTYSSINDTEAAGATLPNTTGFLLGQRINSTTLKYYFRGSLFDTITRTSTSIVNRSLYLGAYNSQVALGATWYSTKECAFSTIGDGLTDDDATNLYYYIQVFQTSLGRQVGSPAYALPNTYDANAKIYLSAIGSTTNNTFNNAINTFITGLKADGIYSKMKAVYPFATDNVNSFSYTEDFSNAYWSKVNVTAALLGKNLNSNFYKIADSVNGTNPFFFISSVLTVGTTYTVSANFKKGEYDYVQMHPSSYAGAVFDLANGVIIYNSVTNASITPMGDGWYRCSITFTSAATNIHFSPNKTSSSGYTYSGTIGYGIYMQSPQLEFGSTATTYQPQLGSAQSYFANQFKYNMINPQDDDTAFRLVFNGGWTHSSTGATPNGTNGYADTKLNSLNNLSLNNYAFGYYSRTNNISVSIIGSESTSILAISPRGTNTLLAGGSNYGLINFTDTNSLGFYQLSRNASNLFKGYKNNILKATDLTATGGNLPNLNVYLGALNKNNASLFYDDRQVAFSYLGDGLTDTEAANLYTRVQTLNQTLLRQVGVPIVSDADAQAFLNNAVITDPTQAAAINNLTIGLKADGLWTKMKAIYPFVGGTATTHKYNLKDPRDLDAAYRLVFNGGWTHDTNGATPNGVNGYADTKLIPLSALSTSSAHLSFYSRTNANQASYDFSAGQHYSLLLYQNTFYVNLEVGGQYNATQVLTNTTGYYIGSRINNTNVNGYRNGIKTINNVAQNSILAAQPLFLAATNSGQYFSTKQVALASIGDGLTDLDATNLYTRVQTYQTTLNRQV